MKTGFPWLIGLYWISMALQLHTPSCSPFRCVGLVLSKAYPTYNEDLVCDYPKADNNLPSGTLWRWINGATFASGPRDEWFETQSLSTHALPIRFCWCLGTHKSQSQNFAESKNKFCYNDRLLWTFVEQPHANRRCELKLILFIFWLGQIRWRIVAQKPACYTS